MQMHDWTIYVEAARQALKVAIGDARYGDRYNAQSARALRWTVPYCVHPVGNVGQLFSECTKMIWLNREYKPLGTQAQWVDYLDFPHHHIDRDHPAVLAIKGHEDFHHRKDDYPFVYLYHDGCPPWADKKSAKRILRIVETALMAEGIKTNANS